MLNLGLALGLGLTLDLGTGLELGLRLGGASLAPFESLRLAAMAGLGGKEGLRLDV